jgi:putative addiction module component (TIGR02574 family)
MHAVLSMRKGDMECRMNERVKKLTEEIRKLSPEEQAELLEVLQALSSREPDPDVEKAWAEEAERRLDAYERGETTAVPLEEVMARLRTRYPRAQ